MIYACVIRFTFIEIYPYSRGGVQRQKFRFLRIGLSKKREKKIWRMNCKLCHKIFTFFDYIDKNNFKILIYLGKCGIIE